MKKLGLIVALLFTSSLLVGQTYQTEQSCQTSASPTCAMTSVSVTSGWNVIGFVINSSSSSSNVTITDSNSDSITDCGGGKVTTGTQGMQMLCGKLGTSNASEVFTCNGTNAQLVTCAVVVYSGGYNYPIASPAGLTFSSATSLSTNASGTLSQSTSLGVGGCGIGSTNRTITGTGSWTSKVTVATSPNVGMFVQNLSATTSVTGTASANSSGTGACLLVVLGTTPAATPTYSPVAGTYSSSQTVTVSCTSPSPTITYCQDRTNTCTPGSTYSSPLTQSTTGYLRSFCNSSGLEQSNTASGFYFIGTAGTQIH